MAARSARTTARPAEPLKPVSQQSRSACGGTYSPWCSSARGTRQPASPWRFSSPRSAASRARIASAVIRIPPSRMIAGETVRRHDPAIREASPPARRKEPEMGVEPAPSLESLDKERVLHPATSIADHLRTGPRIMTEGSGITLRDTAGRRYLDAVAGLWCVNIGYGRTEVADAMAAQARRLAYYHTFSSMSNEP